MKSDSQMKKDVLAELACEPSVNAAHIGVTARDGVVTLNGSVKSFSEKHRAEVATKRIGGVRGIVEELKVKLPLLHRRDDADIASAALRALEWDSSVPSNTVQVKVEGAWLTLTGEVDHLFEKRHAEEDMTRLYGIEGLSNQIAVKPSVNTESIKNDIEEHFKRHATLDASEIKIETKEGLVTLRGKAPSWAAKEEALQAATLAPGVTEVIDDLTVG